MKKRSRRGLSAAVTPGLLALSLGALLASGARPASAAPSLRAQVTQNGDFVLLGNTLGQDCGPGVPAPVVGTIGACGSQINDTSQDVFWQSDSPGVGQASAGTAIPSVSAGSTAVLNLPAGAVVTHAYLYWAASRAVQTLDTTATLARPGVFSNDVNAVNSYQATYDLLYFSQSVADITATVQTHGSGPYRVSNVDVALLSDKASESLFGGWWMVVLYTLPGAPLRNLAVLEGMDAVLPGLPVNAMLSGFTIPAGGAAAKMGVIAFEGDNQNGGDGLSFNGIPLSDPKNPANNFFNSSRTLLGVPVSNVGDLPQLTGNPQSLSQVDLDVVDLSIATAVGQSSATIQAQTSGDIFLLGGLVTSLPSSRADLSTSTKTALDDNGGGALPGETVTYTITVTNSGQDTAVSTVLSDPLPAGVVFVPGSITITQGPNAGMKSDGAADDEAEYDAATHTLTARLGAGAGAAQGGSLAPNESTTLTFGVTIGANTSGIVSNQASISAAAQLGGAAKSYPTDGNGDAAGAPPTTFVVNPALDSDGDGLTDVQEIAAKVDPYDADSDDDGALDGAEPAWNGDSDGDGKIDALDPDSDDDGLFDGTELGEDCANAATDLQKGQCTPDADLGATTTDPRDADSDQGGVSDGLEDVNKNGTLDALERDPNDPLDDKLVPCTGDPECGGPASGVVCDLPAQHCVDGCRGTGNGCPPDEDCSSTDDTIGTCVPVMGTGGMGGTGGMMGTGGSTGGGGQGGTATTSGTGGSAGSTGVGGSAGHGGAGGHSTTSSGEGGALEPGVVQGGCACEATGHDVDANGCASALLLLAAATRRRRSGRASTRRRPPSPR